MKESKKIAFRELRKISSNMAIIMMIEEGWTFDDFKKILSAANMSKSTIYRERKRWVELQDKESVRYKVASQLRDDLNAIRK